MLRLGMDMQQGILNKNLWVISVILRPKAENILSIMRRRVASDSGGGMLILSSRMR